MQTYHLQAIVEKDGCIVITGLPLKAGEKIEIAIQQFDQKANSIEKYPLRGKSYQFIDPFDPVAKDDWDVLKQH